MKKAVLVGCNYPGTKAELKGCVNDVWRMHKSLVERFGFAEEDIEVLIDVETEEGGGRRYAEPTGANIRDAMHRLVASASGAGDVLVFHYSGHGTRLPAKESDSDDLTGYDECIVPSDMNLITDEDFREMVDKLPKGASLTIVSDSCHSGGLIEHEKEQIGDSFQLDGAGAEEEGGGGGQRDYYGGGEEEESGGGWQGWLKKGVKKALESEEVREAFGEWGGGGGGGGAAARRGAVEVKNKALSFETLVELLKDKSGREDIEEGNVRTSLWDIFGDDVSSKVKRVMGLVGSGEGGGSNDSSSWVGSLATQFITQQLQGFGGGGDGGGREEEEAAPPPFDAGGGGRYSRGKPDRGVLVSGCQTDQTSADANPGNGDAYGALSNAIQTVLAAAEPGQTVTNRQLVKEVRKLLSSQGFTQQPGLYCTDETAEAPFICHSN